TSGRATADLHRRGRPVHLPQNRRTGRRVDHTRRVARQTRRHPRTLRRRRPQGRQGPDEMPKLLQVHLSWAPTDEQAWRNAMQQWPNGGMKFPKADIRSPFDFQQMAKLVRAEDYEGRMVVSSDPDEHRAALQKFVDAGFTRIYLHNVGRNQQEWLETFGREVLPKLTV